jgi:hypothetical protein
MDANGAIENAARVAAYVSARDAGESIQSAVDTAANVTVDFARKGKRTPLFSSLYLFFNPAVQGARRTLKLAFSPKGAAAVTGLATLGYFLAEMAYQALGDDDEPYWDKPNLTEKTETGQPLMPQNRFNDRPDSELYFTNTRGTYLQKFTEWMNEAAGGSSVVAGEFGKGVPFDASISPETLKYMIGFETGGAGSFVRGMSTAVLSEMSIGDGVSLEKNQWPILKAIFRKADIRADQSAFYENSDTADRALQEFKAYANREPGPAVLERIMANQSIAALGKAQEAYRKALSGLRKQEIEVIDSELTPKEKEAERESKEVAKELSAAR